MYLGKIIYRNPLADKAQHVMTLAQPDDIHHSAEQCVWRHTTRAALEQPENMKHVILILK